jgi:hypothetical protein
MKSSQIYMKSLVHALFYLALFTSLHAQQPITEANTWITQNFDSMGSSATANLPAGWRVGSARDAIDWSNGLTTTTSAGGTTGSGSISGGGCYNFGNGINASSTDRGLGFVGAEGTLGVGVYRTPRSIIYAFRNDTGRLITALDLSWSYEKYRNGSRTNEWTFFHGSSSSPSTAVAAGNQSYPSDGNTNLVNPPTTTAKSLRIGNLSIAPGAFHYLRWTYTGIGGDTFSHGLGIDDFSIRVQNPTVLISPSAFQPFNAIFGSSSTPQTFTVNGSDLTGDVLVNAPSGYEVSRDGNTFASQVILSREADGSVASTVHVRLKANAPRGTVSGSLSVTSPEVIVQSFTLNGTVSTTLSASNASLAGFEASLGSASATQSLTITGAGLSHPVTVTAPPGFQVSTDNVNFSSSVRVNRPGGTIQSVYREAFGNYTTASGKIWASGSGSEFPNSSAFAAITTNGSVVTWGSANTGGNSTSVAGSLSSNVTAVYSNGSAFAALKSDGSVVTWGSATQGGNSSSVAGNLSSNVTAVYSTTTAFAALKSDGSVVTWGNGNGGDSSSVSGNLSSNVTAVYSTNTAFAALKSDGSVVTWGNANNGGNSSSVSGNLSSNVIAVYSNAGAFAAVKNDGSVVTWGWPGSGGDSSSVSGSLSSNVTAVYSTVDAFAAVKSDGSVVTWGIDSSGGNSSSVAGNLSSNVTAVYSTGSAFAALKSDGSVVTWGSAGSGGDSSSVAGNLSSNVTAVYSTEAAFAALKSDGSVVTWGSANTGGNSTSVAGSLISNVTAVYSTQTAFAALKSDGSVVTWGDVNFGGDSSSISGNLSSNVTAVYSTRRAFAAVKSDGSVVTWGDVSEGGAGGPANIGAPTPLPATLYVRLAPNAPVGPVSGNLTLDSFGAPSSSVSLTGFVSGVFTPSITSLTGFSASEGNASSAQSFTLNGTGVTSPIQVTAPTGFEVSSDGVNFSSSIVLQGEPGRIATVDRDGSLEGRGQVWFRGSGTEFSNALTFAAIRGDGSVQAWGDAVLGGDTSSVANLLQGGIREIYSNVHAYAALKEDGSLVVWGLPSRGGEASAVAAQLASGVVKVSSTPRAFAALKQDGSVVFWGEMGSASTGHYLIPFSEVASQVASGVVEIYSASDAFAALKSDGSVVTWGSGYDGGDSSRVASSIDSGVVEIVPVIGGFAALKSNGSVVSWGAFSTRPILGLGQVTIEEESAIIPESLASALASGVVKVVSSGFSFAAIKDDGSVITWGSPTFSAAPSSEALAALQSGVVDVFSNRTSMAALKADGSVVTWGQPGAGGDSSAVVEELAGGVVDIFSNESAFAALKNDGSVVTWGQPNKGGLPSKAIPDPDNFFMTFTYVSVADELSSGVVRIQGTQGAFAALKNDGSVVAWGDSQFGGDERVVAAQLTSGVRTIYSNYYAFVAQKNDGTLVSWGNPVSGADKAPASISGPPAFPATIHVRMAEGANAGVFSGNLQIASSGVVAETIALTGTSIALTLSVSSLSGFETEYGVASLFQTFDLSGGGFNVPVRISAPTGYEIAFADGSYHGILDLDPAGDGSISLQTIRVRLAADAPVGVIAGTVSITAAGYPEQTIALTGEVLPGMIASPESLTGFETTFGSASLAQSFTVSGGGLTGPVTINAPEGYQISTNGTNFAALVTLHGELDGTLAATTLQVRIASDSAVGSAVGAIVIASAGIESRTIALSGSVLPSLFASSSALSGFVAAEGEASSSKTFTLNGAGLTAPVQLNAPKGYEISLDGANFNTSLRLGGAPKLQTIFRNRPGLPHRGAFNDIGSGTEFPNINAFAVVTASGSVEAWGRTSDGGSTASVVHLLTSDVVEIFSTWRAFAALKGDGSVVTWGDANQGGNSSAVGPQLQSGVVTISSTASAFAALKADGSVVTWGVQGGNSSSVAPELTANVIQIYSTQRAFAALKSDGSVVTWGNSTDGGDSSAVEASLRSDVVAVFSNQYAFAALKKDGSVVTWGNADQGGDSSLVAAALSSGVASITATRGAFAAIKTDGAVVAWGNDFDGGTIPVATASKLASGVVEIFAARSAFAALKSNGAVVPWGTSSLGGDSSSVSSQLSSGVVAVYATTNAFAALKTDGSVVTWGSLNAGGNSSAVASALTSGVQAIYSTETAFAALKTDGSVVTWGAASSGGDSSAVASALTSGVIAVTANRTAFTALKLNGSLISWGDQSSGGMGTITNVGTFVPPSLPALIHVRMASSATSATLEGDLSILSAGMRTETVTLSGSLGNPSTPPYETWVAQWFAQHPSFNGEAALPDADPDGDGISNLMEYALGLNPNTPGVIPAALVINGAQLEYAYTRSTAAREAGLLYQIEWSDTLEPGSWTTETVTQQIESTEGALETVKATVSAGNADRRFLRLRVDSIEN